VAAAAAAEGSRSEAIQSSLADETLINYSRKFLFPPFQVGVIEALLALPRLLLLFFFVVAGGADKPAGHFTENLPPREVVVEEEEEDGKRGEKRKGVTEGAED
jgi:hypothetical protein